MQMLLGCLPAATVTEAVVVRTVCRCLTAQEPVLLHGRLPKNATALQ